MEVQAVACSLTQPQTSTQWHVADDNRCHTYVSQQPCNLAHKITDLLLYTCFFDPACVPSLLPPLSNSSGLQEVFRFDGLFKGFTFRAGMPRLLPNLLKTLQALPHIKAIEPDQLFYPALASGTHPGSSSGVSSSGSLAVTSSSWGCRQQPPAAITTV